MAKNDDRYQVYLEAFMRAVMDHVPLPERHSCGAVVFAACQAIAVRDAKDGDGPIAYDELVAKLKALGVAD